MEVARAYTRGVMTAFTSITPNLIAQDIDRSAAFHREVHGFTDGHILTFAERVAGDERQP